MNDIVLEIPFFGGIDESTRDELLEPGKAFRAIQNARQDERGGLAKRPGYDSLSRDRFDGTTRTLGHRLLSHRGRTCVIDGTHLDTHAEAQDASAVASRVPEASVSSRTLSTLGTGLYDLVQCNGYVACAVLQNGVQVMAGLETADGVVVRSPEVVFTASVAETAALLGSYGTFIFLLAADSASSNVVAYYLDTASLATIAAGWQSLGNVATDKATGLSGLALSTQSLTNRVAFAYVNDSGGTSQLTVKTLAAAGVVETATINTSSATPEVVAVEGSIADTLWVAWNEGATVKLVGLDADALATTLATTASVFSGTFATGGITAPFIVSSSTPGQGRIAINTTSTAAGFGSPSVPVLGVATFTTAGGAISASTPEFVFGVSMLVRPVRFGSRYYGLFTAGERGNGVVVLGDWTDTTSLATRWIRPVGWAWPYLARAAGLGGLHPVVDLTTVGYAVAVDRSAIGGTIELVTYDFADRNRWRAVSHNGGTFLAAGILAHFDGRRVAEAGFLHAPAKPIASDSGSGSGVTGPVRYVVTFDEMDNAGNWWSSGVSFPSDALTITDNAATVVVPPLAISARLSATTDPRVRASLWRTRQGGEPPYYYVGSVANVTGGNLVFTDRTTDAELMGHRLLYGSGNLPGTSENGVLAAQDHRAPPFVQDLVSANGMLIVASGSDLWWSGDTVDGEGTWFSPAFQVPVPGEGHVTAVTAQDGTIYAFKRRSIFALVGDPPSDNGQIGGLGTPRRLAVDVGCIDPSSVVATSLGIFFQSERGIELLTRSGSVMWIGEQIQKTLAEYPNVTSAVLDDRNGLVRFSLAGSIGPQSGLVEPEFGEGGTDGNARDLIFDLALGVWFSVDRKRGTFDNEGSQDAAMLYVGGEYRYGWLGTDGTVYYERLPDENGAHLDGNAWIKMRVETSWVHIAGIGGEQVIERILQLASKHTDHGLRREVFRDYVDADPQVTTWTWAQISALPKQWLEKELAVSRGQAVRIVLEDEEPTDDDPTLYDIASGKGATWVSLTFVGVPHRGSRRTSAAERG